MNCNGRFSVVLCFHRVHHGDDLADLDELPELRLFKLFNEIPSTNDEANLHGAMIHTCSYLHHSG